MQATHFTVDDDVIDDAAHNYLIARRVAKSAYAVTFSPMTSYCSGARPCASGLGTAMVCTGTTASTGKRTMRYARNWRPDRPT